MSFAFPLGFLGLLSLPAIVALHLMRERQRRMLVSSLKLWSFLEPEVRGSRPRRIPLTWLLVLDLLVAGLLTLALTQPSLALKLPARGAKQVLVLLDASTSMLARDETPSRLARAQLEITALLNSLGPRDSAAVLSFGAAPGWIGDTRSSDLTELLSALSALQAGETGSSLAEALAVGLSQAGPDLPLEIHIFTDGAFQDPQLAALNSPVTWHWVGKNTANQAVIGLSTVIDPAGGYQVFAQLANFSEQPVARNVTLLIDGVAVDSISYTLPANSVTPQVWYRQGAAGAASVTLAGGDLLKEDDSATVGIQSGRQTRVVAVAADPAVFGRLLNALPEADAQATTPDGYRQQESVDLTIFRGWLPPELPPGNVLILQPVVGAASTPEGLPAPTSRVDIPVGAALLLNAGAPLLEGLDFNGVRWSGAFLYNEGLQGFDALVSVEVDGQAVPLLLQRTTARGSVYLLAADLEAGNLTRHPLYPTLIARCLEAALHVALPPAIQAGEGLPLPDPAGYRALTIYPPGLAPVVFQRAWPGLWDAARAPGDYRLDLEGSDGGMATLHVGVNAGSLRESNIRPMPWAAQTAQAARQAGAPAAQQDLLLAPWLLAAAIFFLLLEAGVAWR